MRVTISASEPEILREAKAGDLFVVNTDALCECVLTRVVYPQFSGALITEAGLTDVVVIGCRAALGEVGHQVTGTVHCLPITTAITRLVQVEPAAFRGHQNSQTDLESAYAPLQAIHERLNQAVESSFAELERTIHASSPERMP